VILTLSSEVGSSLFWFISNLSIEIVHATFKDANGYVEGLTEEQIDHCIKQVQEYRKRCEVISSIPRELLMDIRESWLATEKHMKELFDLDLFLDTPELPREVQVNNQDVGLLKNILKDLNKVTTHASQLISSQKTTEDNTTQPPVVEEVKEPIVEDITDKAATPQPTEPENTHHQALVVTEVTPTDPDQEQKHPEQHPTETEELHETAPIVEEVVQSPQEPTVSQVPDVQMSESPATDTAATTEAESAQKVEDPPATVEQVNTPQEEQPNNTQQTEQPKVEQPR
jgi:hypothetical protein